MATTDGSVFFTVVIPTYNRAEFVVQAVSSVLAQTFIDFEALVIDDGSTDKTREKIEEQFSAEKRVTYFRQENSERGAARNNGIRKARGQYITFLDSDDLLHPGHLASLKKAIDTHPSVRLLA